MTEQDISGGQRRGTRLSQTHSEGFDILKLTIDAREGGKKAEFKHFVIPSQGGEQKSAVRGCECAF